MLVLKKNPFKSAVCYIVKNKECTDLLSSTKGSEQPEKTIKVHDDKVIHMVQKNNVTTSNQIKNTFKEARV